MRLYLDEDLAPTIAAILRRKRIDVVTAREAGNAQLDDRAQLAYATREGRAIVTANVVDFVQLAREAVATNTEHAGIVLITSTFRRYEFQAIADAIVRTLQPYHGGLTGLVLYISRR